MPDYVVDLPPEVRESCVRALGARVAALLSRVCTCAHKAKPGAKGAAAKAALCACRRRAITDIVMEFEEHHGALTVVEHQIVYGTNVVP